jgi:uncharacterized membrane protein
VTLAISAYEWFLFFHILGATVWVGGGIFLTALMARGLRSREPTQLLGLMQQVGPIGGPVFGAAGLVLVGFGFGLTEKGNWGYDEFFVQYGIAAWLVSTLIGAIYYGRAGKKIGETVAARGPEAAVPALRRYFRVGLTDTLILLSALFVMSAKPLL